MTWGVIMAVLRDSHLVLEGLSSTPRMTYQLDDGYPCSLSYSSWITSKSTPPSSCLCGYRLIHFTLTLRKNHHYFMDWET